MNNMLRCLFTRDLRLVWVINLGLLVTYTFFSILLPLHIQRAGYSDSINGFILGSSAIGMMLSMLFMGPAIDQGDSRIFLTAGCLLYALTSALILLPASYALLLIIRLTQGFGFGIFYTASVVYATRSVPDEMRGTVIGLIEAVGAFSISLTPFLAVSISNRFGFTSAFLFAGVLSTTVSAAALKLHRLPPLQGMPSSATGHRFRLLSLHAVPAGLVSAALFFAATSYVSLSPLIAQRVGASSISLYMGLRALSTVPTRLFSGVIADRIGVRWAVLPGFSLAAAAMILLPFLTAPGWHYIVPVLLGLGMGISSPAITTWMLKNIPLSERAVALNTFSIIVESGGFFGTWLAGFLLESGSLNGFLILAVVLAAGAILYISLQGR